MSALPYIICFLWIGHWKLCNQLLQPYTNLMGWIMPLQKHILLNEGSDIYFNQEGNDNYDIHFNQCHKWQINA